MAIQKNDNPLSKINGKRVFIAVVIGLGIVAFLLIKDFNKEAFEHMPFTFSAFLFLGLALLFMVFRDVGYMLRIRILTKKRLKLETSFPCDYALGVLIGTHALGSGRDYNSNDIR